MAVLTAHADGSYDWQCEGCGGVRARYGPYRARHPAVRRTTIATLRWQLAGERARRARETAGDPETSIAS